MRLTKSERHTAYILLLSEVEWSEENYHPPFICNILERISGLRDCDIETMLPELYLKRPMGVGCAWWITTDYCSRKKALQQCIEETYDFEKEVES